MCIYFVSEIILAARVKYLFLDRVCTDVTHRVSGLHVVYHYRGIQIAGVGGGDGGLYIHVHVCF